jgi:hypothetical protein
MMESFEMSNVRRIEPAEGVPDGSYIGSQTGYTVRFETPHGTYQGQVTYGVRGINIPRLILVRDGKFSVHHYIGD